MGDQIEGDRQLAAPDVGYLGIGQCRPIGDEALPEVPGGLLEIEAWVEAASPTHDATR